MMLLGTTNLHHATHHEILSMIDQPQYLEAQQRLAQGWNTWDTRSLLNWVKLPNAVSINLGIKSFAGIANHLRSVQIGRQNVRVGDHAYDGSYSDLTLKHINTSVRIRTAVVDGDLVILAEPACTSVRKSLLIAEIGLLWNKPGNITKHGDILEAKTPDETVSVYSVGTHIEDPYVHAMGPYVGLELSEPVGLSTGKPRTLREIQAAIAGKENSRRDERSDHTDTADILEAIQMCTAWDTVYDPLNKRVVTPVSRWWNGHRYGGYALFCWDTFFAGVLASIDHPDLAHANVIEILREATEDGFVPNLGSGSGRKTRDRSQPPVGSISVWEVYQEHGQRWLLEQCFEPLLKWNRWWLAARQQDRYLCWGSTPYEPVIGDRREIGQQNTRFGAALESGLDNSPMYDDIPFDAEGNHLMQLADVGLMSMFIADCKALIQIARELGRDGEIEALEQSSEAMRASLQTLWSDDDGLFLNKRLDTGEFERRLSPTHFYPLLAQAATSEQAQRMVNENLLDTNKFWGTWVLPSIAKNDPAYPDQDYWRGRIWAPMNWLVYLGLSHYDELAETRAALAEKSKALFLKEWREHRHVHENYNNDTGEGDDVDNSDSFYHWGCLLGLIALREAKHAG